MDRKELKEKLEPFVAKCKESGKPLDEICLKEAYPGDTSTSFIVQVKAPWIDTMPCSTAIGVLIDILFDTTEVETRKSVFSIQLNSKDRFLCSSETVVEKS